MWTELIVDQDGFGEAEEWLYEGEFEDEWGTWVYVGSRVREIPMIDESEPMLKIDLQPLRRGPTPTFVLEFRLKNWEAHDIFLYMAENEKAERKGTARRGLLSRRPGRGKPSATPPENSEDQASSSPARKKRQVTDDPTNIASSSSQLAGLNQTEAKKKRYQPPVTFGCVKSACAFGLGEIPLLGMLIFAPSRRLLP